MAGSGGDFRRRQAKKIRAMALVQGAELSEIIVESGESAKSLNRPGMARLLAMVTGVR
jgi:DNA invertase Pin-like site-specific DNA recombinase